MKLVGEEIFAPSAMERSICQRVAEASGPTKPYLKLDRESSFIDKEWTSRIVKGLIEISLMPPNSDYHGIRPVEADYFVGDLIGEAADYLRPMRIESR